MGRDNELSEDAPRPHLHPRAVGPAEKHAFRGTILSLFTRGCLIETGVAEQLQGKANFIQLPSLSRQPVSLRGNVIYLHDGKCGVEFTGLTGKEKGRLVELVRHHRTNRNE